MHVCALLLIKLQSVFQMHALKNLVKMPYKAAVAMYAIESNTTSTNHYFNQR